MTGFHFINLKCTLEHTAKNTSAMSIRPLTINFDKLVAASLENPPSGYCKTCFLVMRRLMTESLNITCISQDGLFEWTNFHNINDYIR